MNDHRNKARFIKINVIENCIIDLLNKVNKIISAIMNSMIEDPNPVPIRFFDKPYKKMMLVRESMLKDKTT